MSAHSTRHALPGPARFLRRAPWENAATLAIVAGVLMLMQPLSLTLYGWSFGVTLIGTVLFTIAGKLPERG